jgi:hypothetical protein
MRACTSVAFLVDRDADELFHFVHRPEAVAVGFDGDGLGFCVCGIYDKDKLIVSLVLSSMH